MKKLIGAGKWLGGIGVIIYILHLLYLRKEDREEIKKAKAEADFWEDEFKKVNHKFVEAWTDNLSWRCLYRQYWQKMEINNVSDRYTIARLNSDDAPDYVEDDD